jgi:hypothetical protein
MTIKRTLMALILLLMPLTTYALPISNMPSMNSNTTLFFFNTLYSSRLLNSITNNTFTLSNITITSPCSDILKGSLPEPPSQPLHINVSCNINPYQPTTHPAPVPEPATMLLVGSGMMAISTFRKFLQNK